MIYRLDIILYFLNEKFIYLYYTHAKRNKTSYIFAECIFNFTKKEINLVA